MKNTFFIILALTVLLFVFWMVFEAFTNLPSFGLKVLFVISAIVMFKNFKESKSENDKYYKIASLAAICVGILFIVGLWNSSKSNYKNNSSSYGREQRCWYCGKVIINSEGRHIHLRNGKCEYCGKSNTDKNDPYYGYGNKN